MSDHSPPARDGTCAPCIGSAESEPQTTSEVPHSKVLRSQISALIPRGGLSTQLVKERETRSRWCFPASTSLSLGEGGSQDQLWLRERDKKESMQAEKGRSVSLEDVGLCWAQSSDSLPPVDRSLPGSEWQGPTFHCGQAGRRVSRGRVFACPTSGPSFPSALPSGSFSRPSSLSHFHA